ncbi:amino acid adenylation domain-containing protein [Amycolatopsis orientalis]|uniref:amino acid adenylation domain-containing protein n=1 Tax=Amycolatopsis orientalis TaxID=31958 RepID=UPI000409B464|nr:amino acid adenylation domain-containing protein [Amycolatopsis orientalis]
MPSQETRNARHCHALCLRLDGPVDADVVAGRFARIAAPGALWAERVPFTAEDPAGARRRARELARPVDARRGARAALIEYSDGRAELVVVAHRAAFDGPALRLLATAVLEGGPAPARSRAPGRRSGAEHVPEWGLGDRAFGDDESAEFRVSLPSGTDPDPERWTSALAAVLARYEPGDRSGRAPGAGLLFALDSAGEYVSCLAPPFPLTVTVGPAELRCHYRPAWVSPPIAAQFVRHLAEAHRTAGKEIFDEAEREHVVALGRPAPAPDGGPRRIPEVFAERASERPDAIALSDEDGQVSYRELDRWSGRLADGLRGAGVNPGDLVGVCLDRSAELVAVLLAVLKAGAAYVPLDPAYPAERLAYTVEDARLSVVITTLTGFPVSPGLRVLTPETVEALCGDGPPATAGGGPDDAAYVIYTSGSTGRPKGVLVPHANVVALVDATRDDFALGATDVWTFFHSVAFDFSVWEIWGCLLTGGHLVVVPYWVSRSPEQVRELLAGHGVTVLSQTPSAFAPLAEVDRAHHERLAVRLVIFGGEPLHAASLLPWLDRYPETRCRLVNMFGITETTVHVTAETITRWHALTGSRSVGRPIPGWRVSVLDESGRLAPPGVAGEIHVAGRGIALGYLRRPGLTAARFPADPFGGGRMYRTGDRGRLRPDGVLEHLGRLDDQVKLRGFRIELGEIRSVLAECAGVTAAAVTLRRTDAADAATGRLDAYVVLSEGTTAAVRERIGRVLPDHMVPATITALPALPVTANGKVDLAALPEPAAPAAAGSLPESDVEDEPAAGDDLASELLAVWRQVLGFAVGASDSFWEIGGNSLLAMRIAAAMRERGLPPLHPRALYLNPTVRALADALRS